MWRTESHDQIASEENEVFFVEGRGAYIILTINQRENDIHP